MPVLAAAGQWDLKCETGARQDLPSLARIYN